MLVVWTDEGMPVVWTGEGMPVAWTGEGCRGYGLGAAILVELVAS